MNKYVSLTQPSQPRFLMCRPQYFAVTYSINPWMDPRAWADSGEQLHATAARQWAGLHRTLLARDAVIEAIEPEAGLPDLVFTANDLDDLIEEPVRLRPSAELAGHRHSICLSQECSIRPAVESLRFLNASISEHAVLSDPAAVSSHHRLLRGRECL